MDINRRLDSLGERWPWFCVLLAVQRRFGEVGGGPLAASITLAAFTSIFPLVLVGISVVGYLSVGRADFVDTVIEQLGLAEDENMAELFTKAINAAADSRQATSIIGLAGFLWAGLGVVGALSHALNSVWQVKGRGMKDRLFGVIWLVGTFILILSGLAVSALASLLPGPAWIGAVPAGIFLYTSLFWFMFRVIGNAPVGWRRLLPGALAAGIGFQLLNTASGLLIPRLLAGSAIYGSIGAVFAILAWLFFFGRLIVYSAILNVVRYERSIGTVTVEVKVPRFRDRVPLRANRSGAIDEAVSS
ncbi:MAG: YihY/virulence factor BrkB family protein [Acidimicrobiales bacterium]